MIVRKRFCVTRHHDHAIAFEPFRLVDGADCLLWSLRARVRATMRDLRQPFFDVFEVAQPNRVVKLAVVIHLDLRERRVGLLQYADTRENLGHAPMARVINDVPCQGLDGRGLTRAPLRATLCCLSHKVIPERRRAEPLPNVTHEGDDRLSEPGAISLRSVHALHESLQRGPRMSLPEWNAAFEKSAKRSRGLVVVGQD